MACTFNKKTISNLLLLFSLFFSLNGKSQDFIWASSTTQQAYGYNAVRSIVTDSQGNIYSTGNFGGTVDFDTSSNSFTLTATPTSTHFWNSFILKLDKDKNFLWVKQITNYSFGGRSVILDKNENVIITGLASGKQIDLNPDLIDEYIINSPTDITGSYIIKLDPNGNFIFGNYYSGAFADESTLDKDDNIITTGISGNSNVDFDAGNGTYTLNNYNNSNDIFVMKNNSNGVLIWAKKIGGNGYDYPASIVCDNLNNIILKGNFETNINFLNSNYTSPYNCDFICKINPNGQDLWFRQLGNIGGMSSIEDKSIKIDRSNNIYFSTTYTSSFNPFTPNFNNVNLSFTSNAYDSILFKINENGGYIWHNSIYGNESQRVYSMAFDKNENLYITAYVNGETFINDNCNQVFPNKNTHSSNEGVLLKFDQAGNFINFKNIVESGLSLDCDFENNLVIGGEFRQQSDFDPSSKTSYLLNTFYSDGFNLKLSQCTSNIPEGEAVQSFCVTNNYTIANLKPCSVAVNWYDSLNSNTPLLKATPIIDGQTYYAAYNDSCLGTERLAVVVIFTPAPTTPVTSNLMFCKSDNAKLFNIQITGQNIKWFDSLTNGILLDNALIIQDGITYYASQTVNGCESDRLSVKVIVNNNALPNTTSPQTFCSQQNATLSSITISGQNIKWYDALTNGNLLLNTTLLQNGITYYASQTINGCESERIPALINIQNTAIPSANLTQTFCASQNPTLNTILVTGTSIKWYDNSSAGNVLPISTPLQDGKTYYATQTLNNCESPTRLGITVALISTLPANNYDELFCDDLNDRTETVNLSSYNSRIISNTTDYSFTYYNSLSGAENETASNKIANFTSRKLVLGENKIYVRINSNTPCYAVAELKLTLLSKPKITIEDIVPICENSSIKIDAGAGFDSYLWSNGATTQTITVDNPGNFSVTVTNNYSTISCSSSKNFIVKNSNKPSINSIETKDWTDTENMITVIVKNNGDYEYSIDGINYQDSNVFSGLASGKYTVEVRDKNGCGSAKDEIFLLMFPKFFTPNGDGYNDTWKIKFSDIEAGLTVKIYDRYGKLIKNLVTNNDSWNGTFNGTELPATDYWFVFTRTNGIEYKGHFSLKR